ncbi:MAG TPA: PKD domain-containing protein, partial [Phycisphaerae bacterium]|nr:PKD domain-containing protein [Phycisphaerae bacterium]
AIRKSGLASRLTYNMLNNGVDWGSTTWAAFAIQMKHGAATWAEMSPEDGLFYWSTDPAVWRRAISYRMQSYGPMYDLDTEAGREAVKTLLNDGYVLNFSTYIASWQYSTIKDDPATTTDDAFIGKDVAVWVNGAQEGHAMTIVGYCDDIWTDVNGNDVVDEGEKGAFRIANSRGDGWHDSGFIWFAYDGIGAASQVTPAPSQPARVEGWWASRVLYSVAYPSYRPKLLAQFTANHAARNQLYMNLGLSTTGATTPASLWTPAMIYGHGGALAFDGTTTACDGSFVYDFTDLAPALGETRRFYLGTRDDAAGNPATLSAFKLIDVVHGTETVCTQTPLVVDNQPVQYIYLDHYYGGNQVPIADAGPDIKVADVDQNNSETVTLDGSASTDPDAGIIVSYVWSENAVQIATGATADVTLAVGTHAITLVVTDNDGGTGEDALLVKVGPGGVTLSYSGADLSQGTGTMTIRCTDAVSGDLWDVDVRRVSAGYIVYMPRFDDLTDSGYFNYAPGLGDSTSGLFTAHTKYYSGVFDVSFEELYKGTDYYQYAVTCRRMATGVEQWRTVTTYTINPATTTGTQWTAQVVFTNTSGGSLSGSYANNSVVSFLSLGIGGYGSTGGSCLSAYSDGVSFHRLPGGVYDAVWIITDNIDPTNDLRESNQPAWGVGEVLANSITSALGLAAERSFLMTTDLANNSTNTYNFDVALEATRLLFKVNPNNFGQPASIPADWTMTRNMTLDINIASAAANVPPVADAGVDQEVADSDDDGYEAVALDGSGSTDSDGDIVSYAWTWSGGQATGVTPEVQLAVGTHTITLTVTDDDDATAQDTVVVTVHEKPSEVTVTYQVTASEDDTYATSSTNNHLYTTMIWPYTSDAWRSFMRWQIDVPAGATILSAHMEVCAHSTTSNASTVQLQLLDYDSCPAFNTANPFGWPVTGSTVNWTLNAWTAGEWDTSAAYDMKDIVQAFVDRGGYAPGNYLGLRGVSYPPSSSRWARTYNYTGNESGARLVVTYEIPEVNELPTADAGQDQDVIDADSGGYETVTLDGSGSSDADGEIVSYAWTWSGGQATGIAPEVQLAVGTHTITLTVTDDGDATAEDTVVVTVIAPTVVQYQVAASEDDTYATSSTNNHAYTTMIWPYTSDAWRSFMRWQLDIPAGATVLAAHVEICAHNTYSNAGTVQLQLLDYDSCPALNTANPFAWAVAGDPVNWTLAPWTAGQWDASADIADIVQEFIGRGSYAPGNYLGLRSVSVPTSYSRWARTWNYAGNQSGAKLVVTYAVLSGN